MVTRAIMCGAILSLVITRPEEFVSALYSGGELPQIPIQAVAGGEVFLEVTVSEDGGVANVKPLRTTPPFTDSTIAAVKGWRFRAAQEPVPPKSGEPLLPVRWKNVVSTVLVAAMFRPPTINTPTLGTPPRDVGAASDETPIPTTAIMPQFPIQMQFDGVVLVEVRIGPGGSPMGVEILRSAPGFDEEAVKAARQCSFRPARVDGLPVAKSAYVVFAFRQPLTRQQQPNRRLGRF